MSSWGPSSTILGSLNVHWCDVHQAHLLLADLLYESLGTQLSLLKLSSRAAKL